MSAAYYTPRLMGWLDKCFNQTLVNVLTKMCAEKHEEWDENMEVALLAYRKVYPTMHTEGQYKSINFI